MCFRCFSALMGSYLIECKVTAESRWPWVKRQIFISNKVFGARLNLEVVATLKPARQSVAKRAEKSGLHAATSWGLNTKQASCWPTHRANDGLYLWTVPVVGADNGRNLDLNAREYTTIRDLLRDLADVRMCECITSYKYDIFTVTFL